MSYNLTASFQPVNSQQQAGSSQEQPECNQVQPVSSKKQLESCHEQAVSSQHYAGSRQQQPGSFQYSRLVVVVVVAIVNNQMSRLILVNMEVGWYFVAARNSNVFQKPIVITQGSPLITLFSLIIKLKLYYTMTKKVKIKRKYHKTLKKC